MKKRIVWMLGLLCTVAQGLWAETTVNSEQELKNAIVNGLDIKLGANIQLDSYLNIEDMTVTIDLNGHKLSRNLSSSSNDGHIFWVHENGHLTIADNSDTHSGSIEGGNATNGGGINVWPGCTLTVTGGTFKNNSASDNGGAIFVRENATANISNASFTGNSAGDHGGAIWNRGTVTATNCSFEKNTANDVGALYNAVLTENNVTYAGTATLTGCTFTGNSSTTGAGALANALGNTEMTIKNCTITRNNASGHGGGIWNGGTLTVDGSSFENNTANDVGGIYNAVSDDGTIAGSATLTGCTFTGNVGTAGAGALANALGNTLMIISGCTITGNTAGSNGGGIWNGGTLKMQGTVTVTDNHRNGDVASNVYLKDETVITLTGALTEDSSIGVELENATGTFTSGYKDIHYQKDPNTFFTADLSVALSVVFDSNREAYLTIINNNDEYYVERSWDSTHEKVASTNKFLKGIIGYDVAPEAEGVYKLVTNAPASDPNAWFQIGGYSDEVAEFYVVYGNVNRETIVVQGKDVHLVLADNATLTLTGGLKLEGDNKLYIHCQSYGDKMGRLMVTNKYENAAGIGSAVHEGNENTVGELVIHGGHIESTGGQYAAGIGSCKRTKDEDLELCKSITVYGGYVKATGGKEGAGIGVGRYNKYFHSAGGDFYLYDGTVLALGGESASGVGGGGRCPGINVMVYGGSLTALGGVDGAGIGSGSDYHGGMYGTQCGGTCTISGGTVTAIGGIKAAGIGGGKLCGGAEVNISGGRVMASGGRDGAGIGGGLYGFGGVVTISGGTVSATGGENASGIGGGYEGKGGNVNITGGTVIAQTTEGAYGPGSAIGEGADSYKGMGELYIGDAMMVGAGNNGSVESILDAAERVDGCWFQYYAEISPCTHPSGITYTINEGGTHTTHCKHCSLSETADHVINDGTGTCICGYKDGGGVYYTITLATSINGKSYEGGGVAAKVGNNMPYTLPVCSSIPEGYDFAGWAVNPTSYNEELPILPNGNEDLKQAGEDITVTGNIGIFARYKDLAISLADGSDNAETLYNYNGKNNASVTLTGRKLWKDGYWNTLCLPFSLTTTEQLSQLGYSALMELDTDDNNTYEHITGFENGTLYLNFKDAESIEAGKPYIVKWSATTPDYSEDPVFTGVTINNTLIPVESADGSIAFVGTYSPYSIAENNNTLLYVGANNTLYYPQPALTDPNAEYNAETNPYVPVTIGSCRAFFQLKTSTSPTQDVRAFVLNFGDDSEQTGIVSASKESGSQRVNEGWFLLDGRKLSSKPTTPGLYIHGAKKVYVKP